MSLTSIEVEFLSRFIRWKLNLKSEEYEAVKSALEKVKEEEEEIEREARALLEKHIKDNPDADPSRTLIMIKKKLAEKRGIVL